jgi:hypothetical protein
MKHASPAALAGLTDLLTQIRAHEGLREKSPGTFYRKSKAFLHFHEDPAGMFADLNLGPDWKRFPATTGAERKALLSAIERALERNP